MRIMLLLSILCMWLLPHSTTLAGPGSPEGKNEEVETEKSLLCLDILQSGLVPVPTLIPSAGIRIAYSHSHEVPDGQLNHSHSSRLNGTVIRYAVEYMDDHIHATGVTHTEEIFSSSYTYIGIFIGFILAWVAVFVSKIVNNGVNSFRDKDIPG